MDLVELDLAIRNLGYSDRCLWDATRILGLLTLIPHTKKKLKVKDIFTLPWDNSDELVTENNVNDVEKMTELMKNLEKKFNQQLKDNENNI